MSVVNHSVPLGTYTQTEKHEVRIPHVRNLLAEDEEEPRRESHHAEEVREKVLLRECQERRGIRVMRLHQEDGVHVDKFLKFPIMMLNRGTRAARIMTRSRGSL